jgi:putative ABC transport system permease protein
MMARLGLLFRVIAKASFFRRSKLTATIAALSVAATLSSAFLSLYFVLPAKMAGQFTALGPNIVIAPRSDQQTFPADLDARLQVRESQLHSAPWLYAIGRVANENVVLGGSDVVRLADVNPSWRISSSNGSGVNIGDFLKSPQAHDDLWVIAGEKSAARFGWRVGDTVEINYGERKLSSPLVAIVSTGGSEDSQLFLPIAQVQALTSNVSQMSLIQARVNGSATDIEQMTQRVAAALPEADVKPLRQVVDSETRVIFKVRALMYGLTAIVLALVILSVMTTVSGLVLDRQKDIAVLKTLGGSDGMLAFLFLGETALAALPAAALGYAAGFALARMAATQLFGSALPWRMDVFASVLVVTVAVALISTTVPMRLVRSLEPAAILKGN